ncbi:hypothetical protein DXG01_008082 [Tephrocybe rancida]|nr:hypothetical protein DXG01_008082 [Tephrocybe rancida]
MTSTEQVVSPQVVKKLEKGIVKEGKIEDSRVKGLFDDLTKTEKERAKAEKAAHKAEDALAKAEKKEVKAVKAASKATHDHDIAVANRHNAEQKEQLKKQVDAKLLKEIQDKKLKAEAALKDQEMHNKAREAKLAELQQGNNDHPEVDESYGGATASVV